MAGKKHPILTVLIIIGAVVLFLATTMFIATKWVRPSSGLSFADKIGVIPIKGPILESHEVVTQLVKFREDNGIKAIILRIDSPGGGVGPSQEIYREVRRTIKTKKIVASMGGVAASGGYYIAAGTDKIVANPGTITGSIGVIMEFVRFEDLLKKIGVSLEVLKSGEFKDLGSPVRELTEKDKKVIQALIEDIQRQFVEAVALGRHLSVEQVKQIADGRIFSGSQAKALGLVDMLGNFRDAVGIAKDMAGIKGEPELVYPKKSALELWDLLFESTTRSFTRMIQKMRTQVSYRWTGLPGLTAKESY
jgi:protease-4